MQAFTNEHVCDGDEQKADKRARATGMPTCIDQTRLQSHPKTTAITDAPPPPSKSETLLHRRRVGLAPPVGELFDSALLDSGFCASVGT